MITLNISDLAIKVLSSLFFRFFIILYSSLLLSFQTSTFAWYIYILIIFLYITMYFYFLKRQKHFLRTINDFLFIFIVLFDKNILEVYNTILLLFPLLNAPNHLNSKRSPILIFILTTFVFTIIYSLHSQLNVKIITYITGFLFLTLISYFEVGRRTVIGRLLKIYESIDQLVSEKNDSIHLQKIYDKTIENIDSAFFGHNSIDMIAGFIRSDNNQDFIYRSSSRFILNYDLNGLTDALREKKHGANISIKINGRQYSDTIYLTIDHYVFLIIFKKKIEQSEWVYILIANEIIIPILRKISKILDFETALDKSKYENTIKLNSDLHYVNDVVKSIHFLKNKFTPIKTYFQLLEKYKTVSPNKKDDLLKIMHENQERAIMSLSAIETKTLQVLDKTNSPFASYSMSDISFKRVYILAKKIWLENFQESDIITHCHVEQMEQNYYLLNEGLLEFLFTDIMENMRKYSDGLQSVTFIYQDYAKIVFENKIEDITRKKSDLRELVKNFNMSYRLEINRRNSFGLVHMMELSEMLNIDCKLSLRDDMYFSTTLIFKR